MGSRNGFRGPGEPEVVSSRASERRKTRSSTERVDETDDVAKVNPEESWFGQEDEEGDASAHAHIKGEAGGASGRVSEDGGSAPMTPERNPTKNTPSKRPVPRQLQILDNEDIDFRSGHDQHETKASASNVPKTPHRISSAKASDVYAAVTSGEVERVREVLETDMGIRGIQQAEEHGYTALMAAAALDDHKAAMEMAGVLLEKGALLASQDLEGYTPLHWAALAGNAEVTSLLISAKANVDASCNNGETPLHLAARYGHHRPCSTLLQAGAQPLARNRRCETALDVAGVGEVTASVCGKGKGGGRVTPKVNMRARKAVRKAIMAGAPSARVLILHHDECLGHVTREGHQEAPARVEEILKKIRSTRGPERFEEYEFLLRGDFERAELDAVGRVHSAAYIAFIKQLSIQVEEAEQPVPFTPRVQTALSKDKKGGDWERGGSEGDTFFSRGSMAAALRAAGAVCTAVEEVLEARSRNAFCCVRPPGHHAGKHGLIKDCISCGFCIFNNVMVGAVHALERYPEVVSRVAIIDLDVHHGNGTEELVRERATTHPNQVFFFSIHLYQPQHTGVPDTYEFYPGTGGVDLMRDNVVNIPICPTWSSTRAQGPSKRTRTHTRVEEKDAVSGDGYDDVFRKCTGRSYFRSQISSRLLPTLRAYNPDLIMLSMGFDGADGDVGNQNIWLEGSPGGLDLSPEDYKWATEEVMAVADVVCGGRVVSVLEGGYGARGFRQVGGQTIPTLDRSTLVDAAAAHMRGLVGSDAFYKNPLRDHPTPL